MNKKTIVVTIGILISLSIMALIIGRGYDDFIKVILIINFYSFKFKGFSKYQEWEISKKFIGYIL